MDVIPALDYPTLFVGTIWVFLSGCCVFLASELAIAWMERCVAAPRAEPPIPSSIAAQMAAVGVCALCANPRPYHEPAFFFEPYAHGTGYGWFRGICAECAEIFTHTETRT